MECKNTILCESTHLSGKLRRDYDIIISMVKMKAYPFLMLCVFLFLLSFYRLGSPTLFDVDEAVFAEATKEMVESGDWITPTYNGVNRYDKPIFFYWLMAASYKVFGVGEFGARFPSAVLGIILCGAVYFFVKHFNGERNALYATVALGLSVFFVAYSHAAVTDMALTFFVTVSLFSFYVSLKKSEFIYGFYVFSALAFLTKGLIGIVFPFGIASIYLITTEGVKGIRKVFSIKGTVLFCLISAPWYVAQTAVNGNEFIRQFFLKHHFMRYTGVISGHRGPVYYYVIVLLAGLFPWIVFLPAGIRRVFKEKDPLALFALIWFGTIVSFFSFSTTKLPNYILPAIPAAAVVIAAGMSDPDVRWKKYANICIAVVSLSIALALLLGLKKYLFNFHVYDTDWIFFAAAIMFSLTILCIYSVFTKKSFYVLTSCMLFLFLLVLSLKALPIANRHLQGTLYKYSLYAGQVMKDDERIIVYGLNNPSIVFYSGHKILNTKNNSELLPFIESGKGRIAIAKARDIETLINLNFSLLESDGTYAILERK
jgi:4-amino-4-deoxy-L-arabinose transferase-like glycosyltransferase